MRPTGVTLIGIYQLLRGAVGIVFALLLMLASSLAARLASLVAEGTAIARLMHGFVHLAGIVVLVLAMLHCVAGFGLLKMQNWGRLLTLLFSAIGLVALLPVIMVAHGLPLILGLINAITIVYLAMPPIKRAFHGEKATLKAAA
jgi:uncharacterized membrane protein (DUF2068 family)